MRAILICLLWTFLFGACQEGFPFAKPRCDVSPGISMAGDYGMTHYLNLESAQSCASSTNRRILVMFTGYACVSSTGMDWSVLRTARVRKLVDEQFTLLVLYVDSKDSLSAPISLDYGDGLDTLYTEGQLNSAREHMWGQCNSQPAYVVLDTSLNPMCTFYYSEDSVEVEEKLRTCIITDN